MKKLVEQIKMAFITVFSVIFVSIVFLGIGIMWVFSEIYMHLFDRKRLKYLREQQNRDRALYDASNSLY